MELNETSNFLRRESLKTKVFYTAELSISVALTQHITCVDYKPMFVVVVSSYYY